MTKSGMADDVFAQFLDQLRRYVRERLVPAEDETIENDGVPEDILACLLYTSPSPRDQRGSRMPSSA